MCKTQSVLLPARQKSDLDTGGAPRDSECNCCRAEGRHRTQRKNTEDFDLSLYNLVMESVPAAAVFKIGPLSVTYKT